MKTKKDVAFGVVALHTDEHNETKVLLVRQKTLRNESYWVVPKGHIEGDETPREAAVRELHEETGVTDITLDPTWEETINFSFMGTGAKINKTVTYFLARAHSDFIKLTQPHEIHEIRWATFAEADELLPHDNTRSVVQAARDFAVKA